jgi:RNA polymerase sigma-70 factor (ECF subfamily)
MERLSASKEEHIAFSTTHWSVVLTAANESSPAAFSALETLCARYWYPVYAFVRRRGFDFHAAEDLTQAFFTDFLERETVKQADRRKGKFRSFLLGALTNFLNNEWDRSLSQKRGGKYRFISLEGMDPEERYRHEPQDMSTPEKFFDRRWALMLMERVLDQLRREYEAAGNSGLLAKLEPCLTAEPVPGRYAIWAGELNLSEGAIRVALHRLRRRFGELLRQEIAQTVTNPTELKEEIRHLFSAL